MISGALLLAIGVRPAGAQSSCYPDAPALLRQQVTNAARALTVTPTASAAAFADLIVIYAVLDQMGGIEGVPAIDFIAETAATDKQLGASARGVGTTTTVEKPNFAKLLSVAIENGTIQRATSGSQLTLSSSLYALAAAIRGDTAQTYERSDLFTRIGVAAAFDVGAGVDDPLANVRSEQMREWSVRVRLTPDRGGRSRQFITYWNTHLQNRVQLNLNAITRAQSALITTATGLTDAVRAMLQHLDANLVRARAGGEADVADLLWCAVETQVVLPLRQGRFNLPAELAEDARRDLIPQLNASIAGRNEVRQLIEQYFKEAENKLNASVAFTEFRPPAGQKFGEVRLLLERKAVDPIKLTVNAGVSWFHEADAASSQEGLRDFAVAVAFEGSRPNPFRTTDLDMSRMRLSGSFRYQRDRQRDAPGRLVGDAKVVQFKVDLPLSMGLTLPVSFSMADAAEFVEEDRKWEAGMHFGLTFDFDKFAALSKALRAR